MGLFGKAKVQVDAARGKSPDLPLSIPISLSAAIDVGTVPSLIVYVVDPILARGEGMRTAKRLYEIASKGAEEPGAGWDYEGLTATVRADLDQLGDLAKVGSVVTSGFVREWTNLGARVAHCEVKFGIQQRAGSLSSIASAALVNATQSIEAPVDRYTAQYLVRWGYAAQRLSFGPNSAPSPRIGTLDTNPRLSLLNRLPGRKEMIYQWLELAPLPSNVRQWNLQQLVEADDLKFIKQIRALNSLIWGIGTNQ